MANTTVENYYRARHSNNKIPIHAILYIKVIELNNVCISDGRGKRVCGRRQGHMANVYTHTNVRVLCAVGGGRVFPQHVTFRTLVSRSVHTRIHHAPTTTTTAAAATGHHRSRRGARCEREDDEGHSTNTVRPATPALYPFTESSILPPWPSSSDH